MVNFTPIPIGATGNAAMMNDPLDELDAVIEDVRDGQFYGAAVTLTIASGAVTITGGYHTIAAEGAVVTDTLDTINGGVIGQLIAIQADTGDTITIDLSTGNIRDNRGVNFTISGDDILTLQYDGSNWRSLRALTTAELIAFVYTTVSVASITLSNIPEVSGTLRLVMGFHGDTTSLQPGYGITVNGIALGYHTLSQTFAQAGFLVNEHLSDTEYDWRSETGSAQMLVSSSGNAASNRLGVKTIDFLNGRNADFLPSLLSGSSDSRDLTTNPEFHVGGGALVPASPETIDEIVITPTGGPDNFLEGFYALYSLGSS